MPIHTISRDFTIATGAASIVVLQDNRYSTYRSFVNDSVNWIYLAKAGVAVLNRGIPLAPSGGSYEITPLNPWTGQVSAIAGGANSVLAITEDESREYTI